MLVCGAQIGVVRWDTAHLLGLVVHHSVHSFVSGIQTVVDVLDSYVSSATGFVKRQCSRRRMLDARQLLAMIPSCCASLCEAAKFPAYIGVERTRRVDFGDSVVMADYLSSQLQPIAAARMLGVVL
jgi:hypothetical protein